MSRIFNKKIIIFVAGLLFLPVLIQAATTGKITGRVTSEEGNPLPGANVIVEGTMLGAATDEDGYYTILNVPPGTYQLNVSMIGYERVRVQNVNVNMGLTTIIDVKLRTQAIGLSEIVVMAETPVVIRDISNSQLNINSEQIEALPINEVTDVISLQAGVQGLTIRGGASRQTSFIVDGIVMNDERSHNPYSAVSLSTVKEIQVQTGGFNAEYGNIRSGVINVVTTEGSKDSYNGALSFQIKPPAPKHFGMSPYDPMSYHNRPYLDDEVCWYGTNPIPEQNYEPWDRFMRRQYPSFKGWIAISQETLSDENPDNDLSPTGAQRVYRYNHRRQGDIKKPDYVGDFSISGPVPVVSKKLGDLRFNLSYRDLQEMFYIPLARDDYDENITRLKLTSDISNKTKLTINSMYGEVHSVSTYNWTTTPTGDVVRSDYTVASLAKTKESLYVPYYYSPASIYRTIIGGKLNHIIDNNSYYEVTLQMNKNVYNTHQGDLRDTSKTVEIFPGYFMDEAPYGYWGYSTGSIGDNIRTGGWMNLGRDNSVVTTYTTRFDYTNQITRTHQIRTGIELVINDYDIKSFTYCPSMTTWNREQVYQVYPYRLGAYIQDKMEFQGFIANVGLRLDYSDANTDKYLLDPYDDFFKQGNGHLIEEQAPREDSKPIVALSPRLGISHPITENSKLYFNYGHFRSEPESTYRFRLQREYNGLVTSIGDPNLKFEKTVAYEIGYSHNILNMFLVNIAAYYKDVTSQIGWITYQNVNSSVRYSKPANNNYEDIRGIELTLDKRWGTWITGFVNYTYMVRSYGWFGYQMYYQDPNAMREYLRDNPYQEKLNPQPYTRANIDFHTPNQFGPAAGRLYPLGGWSASFLFTWTAGSKTTWNPTSVPGLVNNVRWVNTYNLDLRLTKSFNFDKFDVQFYMDVSNLLNSKFLSYNGIADTYDYNDYRESLHFSAKVYEELGYNGITGDDNLGSYRDWNTEFQPMRYLEHLSSSINADKTWYYVGNTTTLVREFPELFSSTDNISSNDRYVQRVEIEDPNNPGTMVEVWKKIDPEDVKKALDDKAYIDMPNLEFNTFANPRALKFGIKIVF
ncbi:MAG: TonB-dependent receptor [Candidatus Marinimicrobia bacterium]|nr:TonB-dependent receptor [Candidatus Neomarinimicrobiota bacterium]